MHWPLTGPPARMHWYDGEYSNSAKVFNQSSAKRKARQAKKKLTKKAQRRNRK